jgi:hypothetical protein
MFYLGMGLAFLCCVVKTLKGYFQMEGWLKYKEPSDKLIGEPTFNPNTLYQGSIKGVINTKDYQRS